MPVTPGAFNGSGNLHGWGQSQSVDPTLLYVRGFDQATQQYKYEVNPRFGTNRLASSVNRAPMQITLDLRLDVGPERDRDPRSSQRGKPREAIAQPKVREQAVDGATSALCHQVDVAVAQPNRVHER